MVPFAEGRITRLRREVKLVLEPPQAAALAERLSSLAPGHESRIAAVYFDAADGRLARGAAARPADCTKIRAKTYDPDRGAVPGRAVLETKRERNGLTLKARTWLPRGHIRAALPSFAPRTLGALEPVVATTYRRRVFQPSPAWRVTLDLDLEFHPASWALLEAPSWHEALAAPFGVEGRAVVEVKFVEGRLPEWLAALAAGAVPFSKFAQAMARARRGQSREA